jgi:ABC-type sugar transport system permease subunit
MKKSGSAYAAPKGVSKKTTGLLFISPAFILLIIFFVIPLFGVIYLSFQEWYLIDTPTFVGIENYKTIYETPQFWTALGVTGKMSLFMTIPGALLAFFLAVMINEGKRTNYISTAILFPLVFPSVVAVFIWEAMYKGDGIINTGLGVNINWLTSPKWALFSLVLMMLWTNIGYYTVIALAGVRDIPIELYEAASIDGAGFFRRIRFVTLPLMKPVLLFLVMIITSDALTLFIQPFLLTQGGPGDATRTLSQLIYQTAFMYTEIGKASAISVILLVIASALAALQFKYFNRGANV